MIIKPKSSKKKIILIAIALLILVGGIVYVLGRVNNWWGASSVSKDDPGVPQTRIEKSEGKEFEVPEELPKESVKDYVLITEDERFKIRRSPGTDNYIVTLYAIINNPSQYDLYKDQLREYKNEALNYLKKTGVTIEKANITYEPQEAKDL